jgi:hypothetical protein
MHWDFGTLNQMEVAKLPAGYEQYYDKFITYCINLKLRPTIPLLKYCIAVSCADIAGTTPTRLLDQQITNQFIGWNISSLPDAVYKSYDPWVYYSMASRYAILAQGLTKYVHQKMNIARYQR